MSNTKVPTLLDLGRVGSPNLGYITVAEVAQNVPFTVERVYWTYFTPNHVVRGHHSHHALEQVIVAVSGIIDLDFEGADGSKYAFKLDDPAQGVYVPPGFWRTIRFSHNAVLLCLASMPYSEHDYVRSYEEFKQRPV